MACIPEQPAHTLPPPPRLPTRRLPEQPGGLDALIELGGGDMRRTLNLLQSTYMSAGEVSAAGVYACAGKPLPADIEECAGWLLNEPLSAAFERIAGLQLAKGLALVDILQQLHP